MQEDAARRVREMKKRAALAVSDDPPPRDASENSKKLPDEVKHISYPVELPAPARQDSTSDTETRIENAQGNEREPIHSLLNLLKEDSDAVLILSLLAIIGQDDHDYITSLALLYLLL